MQYYLAPLEGVTGYVFRNAYHANFESMDKYFVPFIRPNYTGKFGSREINDLSPDNNKGMNAIPQILTNKAEDFIRSAMWLKEMGYEEVNLNLGCPSKTVISKFCGSGFLAKPDELNQFLGRICEEVPMKISVKTRIGKVDAEEFGNLIEIYNRHPLSEVIVHPRLQTDFYKGKPDWDTFEIAVKECKHPICYNGDIFSKEDFKKFKERFPSVDRIMVGRGILRNPGLVEELKGNPRAEVGRLRKFHDKLYEDYQKVSCGGKNVLFKMKEFWFYFGEYFPEGKKSLKKIKKAEKLWIYEEAVNDLVDSIS